MGVEELKGKQPLAINSVDFITGAFETARLSDPSMGEKISSVLLEYGRQVQNQFHSEDFSRQPGIRIYLTSDGIKRATDTFKRFNYSIPKTQSLLPNLLVLSFPKGIYLMGREACQFYQDVSEVWEGVSRGTPRLGLANKPFLLPYTAVVRVEGKAGEFWQNWDFKWDGSSNSVVPKNI